MGQIKYLIDTKPGESPIPMRKLRHLTRREMAYAIKRGEIPGTVNPDAPKAAHRARRAKGGTA